MDSPRGRSAAAVTTAAPALGLAANPWQLDPGTAHVGFEVPYWWGLGTVKGRFTRCSGRIDLGAEPAVLLTIEADSVDTGNPRRDRRLRSPEFLSTKEHPRMAFVSDRVETRSETLAVSGMLAARGRGIEIEVEAAVRPVGDDYELAAEVFAMHRGLGMTWNPLGITRPYSKLIVRGVLIPAAARATPRRHELAPTVQDDLAPYRPVRLRRRPRPHLRRRCPSR